MSNKSSTNEFDFSDYTIDENNTLSTPDFTPGFDYDEWKPEDFKLDPSDPKLPEYEPPDLGADNPLYEPELPKLAVDKSLYEPEPSKSKDRDLFDIKPKSSDTEVLKSETPELPKFDVARSLYEPEPSESKDKDLVSDTKIKDFEPKLSEYEKLGLLADRSSSELKPSESKGIDLLDIEPKGFDLEKYNLGLDSLEPIYLSEDTNDRLTVDPADKLIQPVDDDRLVFNKVDVSTDRLGTVFNDFLTGNNFADTIEGFAGNDIIDGWGGSDRLIGGTGNDLLRGGIGNDRLIGTNPTDLYAGRNEYDGLVGGYGADAFVLGDKSGGYYLGKGSATIWDFNAKAGDSIQLTGSASDYSIEDSNFNFGSTNIFYGSDLIATVRDTDLIPSSSIDFV